MKPEKFGKYTLLGRLGKGGMAEVFLARAESVDGFQKLLAVKRLLSPFNRDEHVISMLADEARLSVWLTHANIVQVLDFGRVGQTYYIAMEYVDGCDLCDLVRMPSGHTPRPLPLATALYVMAQVADALCYAHHRTSQLGEPLGIVHRDVSPHNILISREGQVKLADFGLARASISTHFSTADVIRGKFSYMPKEQAHGREIDHRIDIFGAGVTLYEALTGVKPYNSTTLAEQLYQLEQPVPPPSAHVPDITPEVDRITMQAIQPEPENRYHDAGDMAEDLLDILDGFSTFNLEANQLSALVANLVGQVPREIQRLPSMSINDIALTDGSLIADAVEQVRQAGVPGPGDVAVMPDVEPEVSLDDEEGDTNEFQHNHHAPPLPPPSTDSFDALKTVALTDEGPATSLPPSVALSHVDVERLPPTEEMGALPEAGDVVSGVLPEEHAGGDHGVDPDDPKVTLSKSMVEEWAPGEEPPPYDTLQDSEEAGDLARQAIGADEAATIQRSPEEMLTHFNRALEEKERLEQQRRQQRRRRTLTAVGVIVGAFVLFGVGIFLGRYMSGTPVQKQPPTPPPKTVQPPPDPDPLPKKPAPPPKKAVAAADVVKDAGARAAAEAGPTRDTAVAKATPDAARPDAAPKPETKTALKTSRPPRKKVRPRRPRRPRRPPPPPPPPDPDKIDTAPDPDEPDPPATTTGFLTVMCDSPARVYVDDASSSRPAPLIKMPLPAGSHRVRVFFQKAKTFSDTQWVFIRAGQTFSLSFSAPTP